MASLSKQYVLSLHSVSSSAGEGKGERRGWVRGNHQHVSSVTAATTPPTDSSQGCADRLAEGCEEEGFQALGLCGGRGGGVGRGGPTGGEGTHFFAAPKNTSAFHTVAHTTKPTYSSSEVSRWWERWRGVAWRVRLCCTPLRYIPPPLLFSLSLKTAAERKRKECYGAKKNAKGRTKKEERKKNIQQPSPYKNYDMLSDP